MQHRCWNTLGVQPSGDAAVAHELLRFDGLAGLAEEFDVVVVLRVEALMQPRPRACCVVQEWAQHKGLFCRVVIPENATVFISQM